MPLYSLDTFGNLEPYLDIEWLLTNGLGGFAFGTAIGCNTRRYHGLLVSATNPPVGRVMTLNRLGEMLILDGDNDHPYELAVNQFRQNFHPRGEQYLRRFELEDLAVWHYEVAGVRVRKQVQIGWKKNLVGIRYTLEADNHRQVEFRVWPFFTLRDFHGLRHANGYDLPAQIDGRNLALSSDQIAAYLTADAGEFIREPAWWYGEVYKIETQRGQDDAEDQFTPGRYTLSFRGKAEINFWASSDPIENPNWDAELKARLEAIDFACAKSAPTGVVRKLMRAANDFIVDRKTLDGKQSKSVIAGYPWFADWGRDTMISLPGLLLVPGRFDDAKKTLVLFADYVSEGMIPNRFDDYTSKPHYNTVDASLWFIHACFEYAKSSGDRATFEQTLRPACQAIIDGYRRGTRFNIKMDDGDGLINQGDEHTQLTWMDAKTGDVAFTPRQGKPVEINALWHHALVLMGEKALASKVAESFRKAFWISPFRGLADVVRSTADAKGYGKDDSIRPNQIFAVSLPNSPLTNEQQAAVVEVVRRELLTPMGLRTLSRGDPKYHARYAGNQFVRDQAYHNGIVWPWLIGAFLDAYLRVNNQSDDAKAQARRWLSPLVDQLNTGCLGQVDEIYEAEDPQRRVGCCAQAWSVAEVLRSAVRLGM